MWKAIDDKYECSDNGFVRHIETKKMLNEISNSGFPSVTFHGRKKSLKNIVAEAFITKPDESYKYVQNIDGNPFNCRAENLKWVKNKCLSSRKKIENELNRSAFDTTDCVFKRKCGANNKRQCSALSKFQCHKCVFYQSPMERKARDEIYGKYKGDAADE